MIKQLGTLATTVVVDSEQDVHPQTGMPVMATTYCLEQYPEILSRKLLALN